MKRALTLIQIILIFPLIFTGCNLPQVTVIPATPFSTQVEAQISDTPSTLIPLSIPESKTPIERADEALFVGDWDQAIALYTEAISDPSVAVQSAAYYGLARTYYDQNDYGAALNMISQALENFPEAKNRALTFFLMGECFRALGQFSEATQAYQEYLNLRPGLIDQYIFERKGDMYHALGDYQNAINTYHQALLNESRNLTFSISFKIGNSYVLLGEYQSAIIEYQNILVQTNNDYTKAQALQSMGESYIAMGETDIGYSKLQQTVNEYPFSYYSYLALITLVDANIQVDPLNRGIIDYNVGQYALAISALEQYLETVPDHGDIAHHYKALSLQKIGSYELAIAEWQEILDTHPNENYYSAAFDEIAYTHSAYLDNYTFAVATYESFVSIVPNHPDAAKFLYYAGRTAEQFSDLQKSAELWQRIGDEYPSSSLGFDGYFQAGISEYRLKNYLIAQGGFQNALGLATTPQEQAQAYFWMGKAQHANGDIDPANQTWIQAMVIDPTGYYSERAEDKVNGIAVFSSINYDFEIDLDLEQLEAEEWMIKTFSIPPETNFNDYAPLTNIPAFIRGSELWELGLYEEARLEFETVRSNINSDALNNYLLTRYLVDLGLYRTAIFSAREVLNLAGYDDADTLTAPIYFNRIRFGLYFRDIVIPAAKINNLDPLFVFSVIRQESLFEGFVTSSAGARGLMQIIPDTGEYIHQKAGWPSSYTSNDLYRSFINIAYGTDYLATQIETFDGELHTALAAYNGGPGNANAWQGIAMGDPDLFVEIIRFSETRLYLKNIYEIHEIYKFLYQTKP